ncbi:CAP domain-containing protein [Sphingomonas sp. 37zxx]|uniref:CAP domain-containing protein n=1 Tax=Sphingomonas sp. 37zxx TaxID=1550073 RepID=UPI00053BFB5D|nr:CAP domain-containing protein [Sphingomonas sp. 37zxx]
MAVFAKGIRQALCGLLILSWPLLAGATDDRANFDARILAAHNRERAGLGLPMLRWNVDLAVGAKQWSDTLGRTGQFMHSPDDPDDELLGENIWGGDVGFFQPEAMVALWVSEKQQFRQGTFPYTSRTGDVMDVSHYTQIVWRSTTDVGCAISRGANEEILVCRYKNPGNIMGRRVY